MILSGADVKQYILHGGLKLDPPLQEDQFQQNGVDMIIASAQVSLISSGDFTLGVTRETITMPNDLCAFVQLRSTWARLGFMMPGTMIDAGFSGSITLEIAKFGGAAYVPLGERFAHIIFAKLSTPSAPYSGKYQNQTGITPAR